ncbi:MAG TPA: hypothetical protein VM286_00955 [Candidatus Thermoplasmatota archaeon]|nr:hypothetical protein [Candidatus Thermoplasmatota archaeon]
MKDKAMELIRRISPVVLNPDENDLFWACYTEDHAIVQRLWKAHPSLTVYTISSWGTENWVHRGVRIVNRMGHLLGTIDLGEGYSEMLWEDELEP